MQFWSKGIRSRGAAAIELIGGLSACRGMQVGTSNWESAPCASIKHLGGWK